MLRIGLALAVCGALAGCATTQDTAQAQAQDCTAQVEESTGSRLETNKVCRPAEGN